MGWRGRPLENSRCVDQREIAGSAEFIGVADGDNV
jgi:hypothetical protein